MTEKELLELKEDIDSAKNEISKLEGRKQTLLEQLKKEWGCSTVKSAKLMLDKKKNKLEALETKITEMTTELENKYFE